MLVKYGLVISLPGGLEAQEVSANSQAGTIVSIIFENISENMMVNPVHILCFVRCNELIHVILEMQYSIADTVIVWRAWAICAESRITRISLMIMLLVDIGAIISFK